VNEHADSTDGWCPSTAANVVAHTGVHHAEIEHVARVHSREPPCSSSTRGRHRRGLPPGVEEHHRWAPDIGKVSGTALNVPIVADPDREVAELYDMIHPGEGDTSTVRSVFIVDPDDKLTLTYPKSVGRNFDAILQVIDALQATDADPIATPADWQPGDRVIAALGVSTEDAETQFENVEELPVDEVTEHADAVPPGRRRSVTPRRRAARPTPRVVHRHDVRRHLRPGAQRSPSISPGRRGPADASSRGPSTCVPGRRRPRRPPSGASA
jgi:hypothetical protein